MRRLYLVARKPGTYARPLLIATILGAAAHVLVLLLLPHPELPSNLLQLFFPLLAIVVTLLERSRSEDRVVRHCWSAVAVAFVIWSAAQVLFLYYMYRPAVRFSGVRLDDMLWLLFGFPLLLAANTTHDELDPVQWMERAQAIFFFVVLYLLIFLHSNRIGLTTAYLVHNLALILCCLLRLPVCTSAREQRLFLRLTLFLVVYGALQTIAEVTFMRGWNLGRMTDLAWTVPSIVFLLLVLRDAMWFTADEAKRATRLIIAVRRVKGLSIASLTFLSIGVSALLATRAPLLGGICVAGCFALFALRTNAREHAWDEAHGRLERTVLRDALTGLGNRVQLRQSLGALLSSPVPGTTAALLFVDLDRFKTINDSLGHASGDSLLIEVARRLSASAPPGSLVCRIGGDEFVVLVSVLDSASAQASGERLLHELRAPYQLGEHVLRCSASIGIVLASTGIGSDELLRTADHAMYRAKQMGKNRVQMFDEGLLTHIHDRWRLEADLRRCVDQGDIDIAFQPILSMNGGEISGFEALARWTHPVRGEVPPAEFIPLAEDTGLILALGNQVLEKACRQVAQWNRAWQTRLSISVNVSPRQFTDMEFVPSVLDALAHAGLEPSLLRLEITESVLLVHEGSVKQILTDIRHHGIRVSLDDFGTGYSSLSFLLKLPVDEVKVDRSFVSEMDHNQERREMVRTVIQLGHSLGKRVVAEGVETEQEFQTLAAMGCDCAQGWLISRPLFARAMEADMSAIASRHIRPTITGQRPALVTLPPRTSQAAWEGRLGSALPANAAS